jgi:hypothetical protein
MIQRKYRKAVLIFCLLFFSLSFVAYGLGIAEKEETVWVEAGFGKPKIEWIEVERFYRKSQQMFTHTFDLTLVMFRETGWSKRVILKRLQKVADIYAQCGIKFGRVKFVTADAPEGMIDFARPGYRDRKIARRVPPTPRPIFFYFRTIPKFNAYGWVETSDNKDIPDAIKNTAWFSLSVTMKLNVKIRHPNYVSEAHELGHILLDSLDHAPGGVENLMAENYDHVNDRLTPDQCRKIKAHRLVKSVK